MPQAHTDGAVLHIPEPPVDREIRVRFGVPTEEFELTHHHDRPIRVRLRGDRVEVMDDLGADLTFFENLASAAG